MTSDQGAFGVPHYSAGHGPSAADPYPLSAADSSQASVVDTMPGRHRRGTAPVADPPVTGPGLGPGPGADGPSGEVPSGGGPSVPAGSAAGRPGRLARLVLGRPEDPRWARPGLLALLAVTAV